MKRVIVIISTLWLFSCSSEKENKIHYPQEQHLQNIKQLTHTRTHTTQTPTGNNKNTHTHKTNKEKQTTTMNNNEKHKSTTQ